MELQDAVARAHLCTRWLRARRDLQVKWPFAKWSLETDPNSSKLLFYNDQMYVPNDLNLCRRITSEHHDTTIAGHPGILATTRSVRLQYYWPGLQSFVRNYINGCAIYQQFNISTCPTKLMLHYFQWFASSFWFYWHSFHDWSPSRRRRLWFDHGRSQPWP